MNGLIPTAGQHSPLAYLASTSHSLMPDGPHGRPPHAAPDGGRAEKAKAKPRALVVDDAPDVTEMLAMLLRFSGYDVVTVFCAPDAYETARTEQFDVIVSDIGMPGMNGYELAERLRALEGYEAVPMIAVTGFAMYDDRERAARAGFNAFLTKPINPTDLIDLVNRMRES